MKLSTRLQLYGAVVPAVLLCAAFGLVGLALGHLLLGEIDRALLGQAAVESVSLFDRLAHAPHLHLDRSPMQEVAHDISASSALYGPDGRLRVQAPVDITVPLQLVPGQTGAAPSLHTVAGQRVLVVSIRSPDGLPHALRLAVDLQRHRSTMRSYWQAAGAIGLAMTLLLLGLQIRHARMLDRRIVALARHMRGLRLGDFAGAPALDEEGDVVSELRNAIAEATAQLQAARDAQERLLADAAHELRTPLAAMRTDVDLALRKERDPAELRDTLHRTRQEVDRLAALSQRLLDHAAVRQTAWDRPEGDVAEVVDAAIRAQSSIAEARGIRLVRSGLPSLRARFQADPLRQVLDNLLDNALRLAPSDTSVTVHLEVTPEAWQVTVADQGPGVPAAQREAIFAPFHRPNKRGTGAGLGLAIVRDVVQRHGGSVWVEDRPDGQTGARFVVQIPHA